MIYLLVFISGVAKAVMDTLQFHYSKSIFINRNEQFWNPLLSWKAKYINNNPVEGRKKWFNIITIPVFKSDAWHLFQSIFLTTLFASIVIYKPITEWVLLDFVILRSVFGLAFVLFYNKILIKK